MRAGADALEARVASAAQMNTDAESKNDMTTIDEFAFAPVGCTYGSFQAAWTRQFQDVLSAAKRSVLWHRDA